MTIRIGSRILAVLLPVLFFGGIAATVFSGYWRTESSKEPVKFEEGEFAGEYDPGDIRGSYSFGDIEAAFGVPAEVTAAAFGFADADDPSAVKAKDVEELYGEGESDLDVGTGAVRWFVALYSGLPYEPDEGTGLPAEAVETLKSLGTLDSDTVLRIEEVSVAAMESTAPITDEGEPADEDRTIKGKTTFGELLAWGVDQEEIERVLGIPMGARGESIRDFAVAEGVEFSLWKDALQGLVDAVE